MDLEGIILSEINLYDLNCICNLKTKANEQAKQNSDTENTVVFVNREVGRGLSLKGVEEGGQEVQTSSHKISKSSGYNRQYGDYSQ